MFSIPAAYFKKPNTDNKSYNNKSYRYKKCKIYHTDRVIKVHVGGTWVKNPLVLQAPMTREQVKNFIDLLEV